LGKYPLKQKRFAFFEKTDFVLGRAHKPAPAQVSSSAESGCGSGRHGQAALPHKTRFVILSGSEESCA